MKIWFRVHGYEACSWTSVYEYLSAAFEKQNIDICTFVEPDRPEDYVELWWGDPQFWRWSRYNVKARISLALSEAHSLLASGRLEAFSNLSQSDMIICPSQSATIAFREAPLDIPIRVVPFGVDCNEFQYKKDSRNWNERLFFLHSGFTQFRKGSWLVPEAFLMAFDENDIVELTIQSDRLSPMFMKLRDEYGKHPRITFVDNREASMNDLYRKHHIYVSPHLSEGFGLIPFEAMATGMPVIMSRCSAPREFFSTDYGWFVEMSEDYAAVEQCLVNTKGFWRLPNIQSLAKCMLEAYENRLECNAKGDAAAKYIRQSLTWDHTANGIIKCIQEVLDGKAVSDNVRLQRRKVASTRSEKYRAIC